ncbi:MAG TPA: pyridoxine 5'-phosphate synthase [Candidatus Omnitrophota bacterium]|nr:pyridoxine 5'-phosphate synthase [Candidatus Omnitrophota bacterium]
MPKLGVNIDHVATVRQARRDIYPNPVDAAIACEKAGAHSIVAHLREDRRHINDKDVSALKKTVRTRFNLEMSIHPAIVEIACRIKPDQATLVPEKRQEITTEGGLDVVKNFTEIKKTVAALSARGICVSLFIAPEEKQILRSKETGAHSIELHTGCYANAKTKTQIRRELERIRNAVTLGNALKLIVNAGHGLNYTNTRAIASIKGIEELNIGHAIIARALFVGLPKATQQMLTITGNK